MIGDNDSERRPRSWSKRDLFKVNKQGSGVFAQKSRKRGMTPPQIKRGKQNMIVQPFMSTTNKRALELKAKVSTKFAGAFEKTKKNRRQKKKSEPRMKLIKENTASDNEADTSPPADDNEILSKQENESVSGSSSEGELPKDDVP